MSQLESKPQFKQVLSDIPTPLMNNTIEQVLQPYVNNLAVTPKEIDDIINNATTVITNSLKDVLHPHMNEDFANCFV